MRRGRKPTAKRCFSSPLRRASSTGVGGLLRSGGLSLRQRVEKQKFSRRQKERAWSLNREGLARSEGRRVPCPSCGAEAGDKCRSARKGNPPRESNHMERVQLAQEGASA